jgi:geranylgeranyl diphosphate synthase type II
MMDIEAYLNEKRELVDSYLKSYFDAQSSPAILREAMRYSIFAGGKRIRPILALTSYEACGRDPKDILPQASALELIHTYSLIHDDLPSMDNDDLRRGKPTNHKVFGEAIAILAGDALLTEAFLMMATTKIQDAGFKIQDNHASCIVHHVSSLKSPSSITNRSILRVIRDVALAAGTSGMVGGQTQDILSENTKPDRDTLEFIHLRKTAALIAASVRMGGILANASIPKLKALSEYGKNIGLAFQIVDDILDVEGTTEDLGKTAGSDINKKKMTYPSLFGIEGARQKAKYLITTAIDSLKIFSSVEEPLRNIATYLIERKA